MDTATTTIGEQLAGLTPRQQTRALQRMAVEMHEAIQHPPAPELPLDDDGESVIPRNAEAEREAVLGISAYWRGLCQCDHTRRDRRKIGDYVPPSCKCQPHKLEHIDRYGFRVTCIVASRPVPEPFTHLAVRVERNPYRRIILGTIADDCLANSRELPDPEIAAMTEPEPQRVEGTPIQILPHGDRCDGFGHRNHRRTVAIRGVCPGCGDPKSDGPLCLKCDSESTSLKLSKLMAMPELAEIAAGIPEERVRGTLRERKALVKELAGMLKAMGDIQRETARRL